MSVVRIAFIHHEKVYLERMCAILRELRVIRPEVKGYTAIDSFLTDIKAVSGSGIFPDMIIAEQSAAEIIMHAVSQNKGIKLIILDETNKAQSCGGFIKPDSNGYWLVDKYQKVEQLAQLLIDILYELPDSVDRRTENGSIISRNTPITSFISCSGGTGCSLISSCICRMLAEKGCAVLFLCMEAICIDYIHESMDVTDIDLRYDKILYQIKTKEIGSWDRININLGKYSFGRGAVNGYIKYLPRPRFARSAAEFSKGDISRLLWMAESKGEFDHIIFDLGCISDDRKYIVYDSSDNLILVLTPDPAEVLKHMQLSTDDINEKMYKVLNNRYYGYKIRNKCGTDYNFGFIATIPYINDIWKMNDDLKTPYSLDNLLLRKDRPLAIALKPLVEKIENSKDTMKWREENAK